MANVLEMLESSATLCGEELDADLLLLNAPMMPGLDISLRDALEQRQDLRANVVLILVTEGGMADIAYRVARLLQGKYDSVTICIAGWCKSAGTLLAIAAHQLVIGEHGEMGPLDVQVAVRDEIGNRNSGLILESALDSLQEASFGLFEKFMMQIKARSANNVTFRTAAELASQMTVGLMAPIFEQIDPIRMGDDARAQKIGQDYAVRLNMTAKNLKSEEALPMLLRGYPSHSFVIDAAEAGWLFSNVQPLTGNLADVVALLGDRAITPVEESDGLVCFVNRVRDNEEPANDEDGRSGIEMPEAPEPTKIHAVKRTGPAAAE